MPGYSQSVLPAFPLKFGALRGIFPKHRRPSCDCRPRCRLKRPGGAGIGSRVMLRPLFRIPRLRAFRKTAHRRVRLGFEIRVFAEKAGFTHGS
ncbi:hypothetical protein NSS14_002179, partial [Neisseria gonorrhoeae]